MLSIVTCIKHPETANNFAQVNQLLQKTVDSLDKQTNPNFQLFIVCNKDSPLSINTHDIKTSIISVDFPATEYIRVIDKASEQRRWQSVRKDKGTKYLVGLNAALKAAAEFVMFIDADDYLHKALVEHVQQNRHNYDGFIINRGLGYQLESHIVYRIEPFNQSCGTCNIYRTSLFAPYLQSACFTSQSAILATVDDYITYEILGSHKNAEKLFQHLGVRYQFIPFEAAMYIISNGENISGINQVGYKAKALSQEICNNFGLTTQPGQFLAVELALLQHRIKATIKNHRDSSLIRSLVKLKNRLH